MKTEKVFFSVTKMTDEFLREEGTLCEQIRRQDPTEAIMVALRTSLAIAQQLSVLSHEVRQLREVFSGWSDRQAG